MKIMFVDDEPKILQGIERMLFHLSDDWDMCFAESGQAALEAMAQEPVDVLVTDMRMPGMDGAQLLTEVQARFPDMVRIVLSGHAELEAAMRAVPVAHQFLSKPCKPELLENVVDRACGLRKLLDDEAVRRIVGTIETLPSVPRIYSELTKALVEEETDAKDVAAIISQDIAMSAKVLQLVNSAFFSQTATISTIEQAVVRLGFQMVKNLALTVEVFADSESTRIAHGFSIETAQSHAFHLAALAKQLISDRTLSEDAFMAGILHDIGKLILAKEMPEKYTEVIAHAAANELPLHQAERQLLGTTHAEIGAYLMGIWGLPYPIVEAIANHHEPSRVAARDEFGILDALYVADCLVNDIEIDTEYLKETGFEEQVGAWQEMASGLEEA